MSGASVAALAIVGKDNEPVYLAAFDGKQDAAVAPSVAAAAAAGGGGGASASTATQAATAAAAAADTALKFHFHVHTSLDVMEEKLAPQRKGGAAAAAPTDLYLGLLFSVEEYRVYGYQTNTRVKFVVILHGGSASSGSGASGSGATESSAVKQWLRELHHLYVAAVSNPFSAAATGGSASGASTPTAIAVADNKTFDAHVRTLIRIFEKR